MNRYLFIYFPLTLILFLSSNTCLWAQNCANLYVFTQPQSNKIESLQVKPAESILKVLTTINNLTNTFIEAGQICADANQQQVFFIKNDQAISSLKTISSVTGNLEYLPSPDISNIFELQYHCNNEILYGLNITSTTPLNVTLVAVSPQNASLTNTSLFKVFANGISLVKGSSILNKTTNVYYFLVKDNSNNYQLVSFNIGTGVVAVNNLSMQLIGIAFDELQNLLFGFTNTFDLITIDPTNGNVISTIGNAALGAIAQAGAIAINYFENELYFSAQQPLNTHKIYTINLTTASLKYPAQTISNPVIDIATAVPCKAISDFSFTNTCEGESAQFTDLSIGASSWTWDFNDPASGAANSSILQNPTHIFTQGGVYTVKLTIGGCFTGTDVVTKQVTVVTPVNLNLGNDIETCSNSVVLDAGSFPNATYTWITGSSNQQITATSSATYWVDVKVGNCIKRDSIKVVLGSSNNNLSLGNDKTACEGELITIDTQIPNAIYNWSNGANTQAISVTQTGNYAVTVTQNNCQFSDSIAVNFTQKPQINLGNDVTECSANYTIDAGTFAGANYLWSTGANTQTINVQNSDTYSVTVSIGLCTDVDTLNVNILGGITPNLGGDANNNINVCGTSTTLNSGIANANSYTWTNGATTQFINVTTPGQYGVAVNVNGCLIGDTVNVNFSSPLTVTLGNDTTICAGSTLTLSPQSTANSVYAWSTGATSSSIDVLEGNTYSVTVTQGACSASASIQVATIQPLAVNLGPDKTICTILGDKLSLDAGSGIQYTWLPNGETSQTITVASEGTYSVNRIDNNGCTSFDEVAVVAQCATTIVFPTAFSPNNDGINDVFKPIARFVENFKLVIFDRWGQKVFTTNDINEGWDGFRGVNKAALGTYIWMATFANNNSEMETIKGNVTIIK